MNSCHEGVRDRNRAGIEAADPARRPDPRTDVPIVDILKVQTNRDVIRTPWRTPWVLPDGQDWNVTTSPPSRVSNAYGRPEVSVPEIAIPIRCVRGISAQKYWAIKLQQDQGCSGLCFSDTFQMALLDFSDNFEFLETVVSKEL
eukprot:gene7084-biopygen2500